MIMLQSRIGAQTAAKINNLRPDQYRVTLLSVWLRDEIVRPKGLPIGAVAESLRAFPSRWCAPPQ